MQDASALRRNQPCPCGSGRRYKRCCGRAGAPPQAGPDGPAVPDRGVLVVEGFLDPDTCRRLRACTETLPSEPGTVRVLDPEETRGYADRAAATRITTLMKTLDAAAVFWPPVARALSDEIGPRFGLEFEWFEWPDVLDYGPGGHFSSHNDCELWDEEASAWRRTEDRDVSLLIYLNEDFEGGGLTFPERGRAIRPATGMLVAFPSDHRYAHQAEPVVSGRRQVIVSWAAARGTPKLSSAPRTGVVYTSPEGLPPAFPLIEVPGAGWYIDPAVRAGRG